jgi:hypothetical protein
MIKLKQVAVALALMGSFAAAQAATLTLNTPNGIVSGISSIDFGPAPVLAQGGNQAFVNAANGVVAGTEASVLGGVGHGFTVYSQGRVVGLTGGSGAVSGLYTEEPFNATAGRYEITFELAYREVVVGATSVLGQNTAFFDLAVDQSVNYFRMYVKDLDVDAAANFAQGTGFNTGTMVFEGTIAAGGAGSLSTFITGGAGTVGGDTSVDNGTSPLSGLPSVTGGGATPEFDLLTVVPTVYDTNFFKNELTSFLITNISQNLPFKTVDPSVVISGQVPNVTCNGCIIDTNGANPGGFEAVGGPDIIFQTDFNGAVTAIPEPGTLALAGLALGGLALARRRKV